MLPNLVVIGAQKCGTTSLHHYLDVHPNILMSRPKEIHYFSHYWQSSLKWYQSHFAKYAEILGESSTSYTMYPKYQDVPLRMRSVLGSDVRFIYILRDPIKRVVSQYVHDYCAGWYDRSIAEVLNDSDLLGRYYYIEISSYYMQLERFLRVFPEKNFKILTLEELSQDPARTMQEVFRFLEVKEDISHDTFYKVYHKSNKKIKRSRQQQMLSNSFPCQNLLRRFPLSLFCRVHKFLSRIDSQPKTTLSKELRQRLIELLKPDIDALRAYTGLLFKDWSL